MNKKFLAGRLFQLHSLVVVQSISPECRGHVDSVCPVGGRINGIARGVGKTVPSVKRTCIAFKPLAVASTKNPHI